LCSTPTAARPHIRCASERSGAIAVSAGKTIAFYDAGSGAQLRSVALEAEPWELRISAAGDRIVLRAEGNRIYALDVGGALPKLVTTLKAKPKFLYAPADSRRMLVMAASGRVQLYDVETGRIAARLSTPWNSGTNTGWHARLNDDASRMTLRTPDNFLRGYRTDDGKTLLDLTWPGEKFADAMPLNDGLRVATASEAGQMIVQAAGAENDAKDMSFATSRQYPSSVRELVLSATADPSQFLTVDGEGRVDLFSTALRSYQTFYTRSPESGVQAALSPDGSLLATVGDGLKLRLWHVAANELLVEILDISKYSRLRPRFTANGRFLIVGSDLDTKILRVPLTGAAAAAEARRKTTASPGTAAPPLQSNSPNPGIVVAELAAEEAQRLRVPGGHGVMVAPVASGGPAEAAGLKAGDVILRIDEVEVASPPEAYAALKKALDFCNVVAVRKGEDLAARLILAR
jgi:hypothetical protein